MTVDQLTPADRACAYGVLQPGEHIEGGVPLIRVGDITNGEIALGGLKRIDPGIAANYQRTRVRGGEVVITLVGAIGRTAVVPDALSGANTARAVGVIPLKSGISPFWVEAWFRSPGVFIEMNKRAHEVARKTLNLEDVKRARVAIPPPEEQEIIVAELQWRSSIINQLSTSIELDLRRAARLRQSILEKAVRGELVPQDPNDEPAAALLERIRAERAAMVRSKPTVQRRNRAQRVPAK